MRECVDTQAVIKKTETKNLVTFTAYVTCWFAVDVRKEGEGEEKEEVDDGQTRATIYGGMGNRYFRMWNKCHQGALLNAVMNPEFAQGAGISKLAERLLASQ
jgi:hypothetical protein